VRGENDSGLLRGERLEDRLFTYLAQRGDKWVVGAMLTSHC